MSGRAAAGLQPHDAGGQIELVLNDDELLRLDPLLTDEACRRTSRLVHVGRGDGEYDRSVLETAFADTRLCARALELDTDLSGELLDEIRSGVVPRLCVVTTRIAESDNELH